MPFHVLTERSGTVLALMLDAGPGAGYGSFIVSAEESCHDIDVEPGLFWPIHQNDLSRFPRLKVVVEDGTAKLVYRSAEGDVEPPRVGALIERRL